MVRTQMQHPQGPFVPQGTDKRFARLQTGSYETNVGDGALDVNDPDRISNAAKESRDARPRHHD
ncbi:MAG: hypothetical protein ABI589_14280, partial [Burkholderiales bacterium]